MTLPVRKTTIDIQARAYTKEEVGTVAQIRTAHGRLACHGALKNNNFCARLI